MSTEVAIRPTVESPDLLTKRVLDGHAAVLRAGIDMISAAAEAGEALFELKPTVPAGTWRQWIEDNLPFSYATAHLYMRCAENRALISDRGWTKLNEVKTGLGAFLEPNHQGKGRNGRTKPEWMKDLAREMFHGERMTYAAIARELNVSSSAVRGWVDPEWEAKSRQKVAAINKRRIRAARLLREQEQRARIKDSLKKASAVDAELYAAAEAFQDIIAAAHRAATDPEKRRHYSLAGEHYRRMRDEIVRAFGVQ
jgi:hypothetical protein